MEIRAIQTNTGSDINQIYQAAPSSTTQTKPEPKAPNSTEAVNISPQGSEAARLAKAVDNISNYMRVKESNLAFSVDNNSGKMMVRVIDKQTDEVIRQIPTEEALAISESLDKIAEKLKGSQNSADK